MSKIQGIYAAAFLHVYVHADGGLSYPKVQKDNSVFYDALHYIIFSQP